MPRHQLVVGLSFNPAAGVFPEQVFANLIVDKYGDGERQRSQPPRPPKHQRNGINNYNKMLNAVKFRLSRISKNVDFSSCLKYTV